MRREKISADRRGLTLLGAAKHSVLLVVNYIGESSGGLRKTTSLHHSFSSLLTLFPPSVIVYACV